MTDRCCIFLGIETEKLASLQGLRSRFDPLAEKIPPHVTVVFPFALDWDPAMLAAVLERQRPLLPIRFSLEAPTAMDDSLAFPLGTGREAVAAIHDRIYRALPSEVRSDHPYLPHVTFGRAGDPARAAAALREAEQVLPVAGMIRRLALEQIGRDDGSTILHEVRVP